MEGFSVAAQSFDCFETMKKNLGMPGPGLQQKTEIPPLAPPGFCPLTAHCAQVPVGPPSGFLSAGVTGPPLPSLPLLAFRLSDKHGLPTLAQLCCPLPHLDESAASDFARTELRGSPCVMPEASSLPAEARVCCPSQRQHPRCHWAGARTTDR